MTELALTDRESRMLKAAESDIAEGCAKAWSALKTIHDQKLYRAEYGTWEDYCEQRWRMSRQHANRLIRQGQLLLTLEESEPKREPIGSVLRESHTREVADLPPEEAAEVLKQAVDTAPKQNGKPKVTAKHVRETRAKREGKPKRKKAKEINPAMSVDSAIKQHFSPLCRIIDDIAEQCGWKRKTARVGHHKAANDALNELSAALKEMRKGDLGA